MRDRGQKYHASGGLEARSQLILAQFYQLETLEASSLDLPPYPVEMDLQLVHTLKYMKIN